MAKNCRNVHLKRPQPRRAASLASGPGQRRGVGAGRPFRLAVHLGSSLNHGAAVEGLTRCRHHHHDHGRHSGMDDRGAAFMTAVPQALDRGPAFSDSGPQVAQASGFRASVG